jgi:hypothetical protein
MCPPPSINELLGGQRLIIVDTEGGRDLYRALQGLAILVVCSTLLTHAEATETLVAANFARDHFVRRLGKPGAVGRASERAPN